MPTTGPAVPGKPEAPTSDPKQGPGPGGAGQSLPGERPQDAKPGPAPNAQPPGPGATLAAEEKAAASAESLVLTGVRGGPFSIRGSGFGPSGSLTVNRVPVINITLWNDENVRGVLPGDVQGEVVLIPSDGGPTQRGHYPAR